MTTPAAPVESPTPGSRFAAAVASVLEHLRTHHPMTIWGVTRLTGSAGSRATRTVDQLSDAARYAQERNRREAATGAG